MVLLNKCTSSKFIKVQTDMSCHLRMVMTFYEMLELVMTMASDGVEGSPPLGGLF